MRKPVNGLLALVTISLAIFVTPSAADMTAADKLRFYRMREEALAKTLANWRTSTSADAPANIARVTREQAELKAKIDALAPPPPRLPAPKCGSDCGGDPYCELKCTGNRR